MYWKQSINTTISRWWKYMKYEYFTWRRDARSVAHIDTLYEEVRGTESTLSDRRLQECKWKKNRLKLNLLSNNSSWSQRGAMHATLWNKYIQIDDANSVPTFPFGRFISHSLLFFVLIWSTSSRYGRWSTVFRAGGVWTPERRPFYRINLNKIFFLRPNEFYFRPAKIVNRQCPMRTFSENKSNHLD